MFRLDIVLLLALESAMPYFLAGWLIGVVALAMAGAVLLSPRSLAQPERSAVPTPDHIVITMMENHSFSQIMDGKDAPYIQGLARHGALFTRSFALLHPSQPNYFALFSGSTHGVTDDEDHSLSGPTLADLLQARGKPVIGYIEDGSPRKHNPWESFPGDRKVERPLADFPTDFAGLPTVSFVIPNEQHDMHDETVAEADRWLRGHLGAYADWCRHHNSLLIVTFDEDNGRDKNRIPTIFVGDGIMPGHYDGRIDHYNVLRTILAMYGLPPLAQTAFVSPITAIWRAR